MKGIIWKGSSKEDLKSFPPSVIDDLGYQLFRVQCGLEPSNWKPMRPVGPGVREIRVKVSAGAFRAIYLAARPEAIYVLHCFQKKTERTDLADVRIVKERLRSM